MYILALAYCVILAAAMLYGLWYDRGYSGGNHWAFYGTRLDQVIQTLGLNGLLALAIPPGLVAVLALTRSHIFWAVMIIGAALVLAAMAYFFAIKALD